MVTATRFPDRYSDKPVSVTVLTREDIAASTARSLPELLALQPGIAMRDLFGNNATLATVDIRGFGATSGQNALILLDGRRLNDIDLSGVQWPAVPLSMIDRVEIVRGAGAVQYGDGATTGVVNIITRRPPAGAQTGTLAASAGNFDTRAAQAGASLGGERVALRMDAAHQSSNGYRDNNASRHRTFAGDVHWYGGEQRLSLRVAADREDLRLPGARIVQPSAGINELETDRRGTSTPLDFADRDGRIVNAEWAGEFDGFSVNLGAGYRNKQQISYFDFGGFPDYREIGLDVFALTPRIRMPLGSAGGSLVAGADLYWWRYDLAVAAGPQFASQPVHLVDADQENRALYLIGNHPLGERTTLSAGARVEWFEIRANDTFDPAAPNPSFLPGGSPNGEQKARQHALDFGVRHQFAGGQSVYARAGRSFRFATVDEIYETSTAFEQTFDFLEPQTAVSYELGWESVTGSGGTLRASLFRIDVDNEIHLDPYSFGVGNRNLPPSRRQGLELSASTPLAESLTLAVNYTYTHARFRGGNFPDRFFAPTVVELADRTVPLVPAHRAVLSADWQAGARSRVGATFSAQSSQFMDNDEGNDLGTRIPGYSLFDLKFTHDVRHVRLSASVNNVFDREYYNYAVRSNFTPDRYAVYPLPGRTFWLSVEVPLGD